MDQGCKFTSGVHCEVKEGSEPNCSKCGWNPEIIFSRKQKLKIEQRTRIERRGANVHITFNKTTFVVPASLLRRVLDER